MGLQFATRIARSAPLVTPSRLKSDEGEVWPSALEQNVAMPMAPSASEVRVEFFMLNAS